MPDIWTIKAALDWTTNDLARTSESNPRLAAQWLLCAATGLERIELYTRFDQPLSAEERTNLRQAIERRRTGEPLQYILGKAPFRHLELKVRPGVLIPRPETEILVDLVLNHLVLITGSQPSGRAMLLPIGSRKSRSPVLPTKAPLEPLLDGRTPTDNAHTTVGAVRIIDLCTGSGCVALSLLHENPDCHVTAVDIDPAAIQLTQENAGLLNPDAQLRLTTVQGDLATELLQDATNHAAYDIIVSNPPYIPTATLADLSQEVAAFEPVLALDGGADGLELFGRIAKQAATLLKPGGLLAVELYEESLEQATTITQAAGFKQIQTHPDLTQRSRFLTATR